MRAREWVVALILLDAVFAVFVAVQLTVLFGGHDHVLETAGLTYAEYAREGFFQLLVVAWLTLVVVALAARHRGERVGLRPTATEALLALLCLLALVVLVSALRRLSLYEDAYGFTVDRLLGHAAILWVGAVLLLVLVAGALRRSEWLPRTLVGVSGAGLIALSLANPEGLVAERNVERYRQTGKIDVVYLRGLSPDATPALTGLPDDEVACALGWTPTALEDPDGLFELNAGRAAARTALARRGPAVEECS